MLQFIAVISLAVFTIVNVLVGVLSSRRTKTMESFLLAGRNLGPLLSAFSYGTSYFSAVIFIGYAGMFGWTIGMGSMWIGIGNAILGCLLAWLILAKPTRRMTHSLNTRTMPEFFAARFLDRRMKVYAALIIFLFLVPYAAGVYKGLGSLFSVIFTQASPTVCMAIVAVLTAVYLILGGYVATAWNDLIQGCIMIFGLLCMVILIVNQPEVGGFSEVTKRLGAIDPALVNPTGGASGKMLIVNILLTSFGVWGMPQMIHKYYAVRKGGSIRIATVISTVFALFIGCGAYFTGALSHLFFWSDADGLPAVEGGYDFIIPTLLTRALTSGVFPVIILCVVMLLLLSASMSTLSALVLSSSSAVSIDLMQAVNPNIDKRKQMVVMRVFCLVFVLLSFLFASMNISFIVNLMSFSWGVVAGSFIGPFLWGLYGKFVTRIGVWAGLLCGPAIVGFLLLYNMSRFGFEAAKGLAPQFGVAAMAASFLIVPAVSLLTGKHGYEPAHIQKVFETEEEGAEEGNGERITERVPRAR
ncbi:MAG: sodium:solute symporter [Clostridiales Family XIII bacterium]|jgi:SSS family solute:Na+ symporter/sodium/proline symporter|nr:sodium:solute symporter [Clostridiales Family XIII bacterium]